MAISPRPFRPTAGLAAAAAVTAPRIPAAPKAPVINAIVPAIVIGGAVYGVGAYMYAQLKRESDAMDRLFEKQNTPELERARQRAFCLDTELDPRRSLYDFLGWK